MKKESDIQGKMIRIAKKYGCYIYKNAQNMYTEKGRPDLTACVPTTIAELEKVFGKDTKIGIFLGIEVKKDKRTYDASEAQQIVGKQIKNAGGLWIATDDADQVEGIMLLLTGENNAI